MNKALEVCEELLDYGETLPRDLESFDLSFNNILHHAAAAVREKKKEGKDMKTAAEVCREFVEYAAGKIPSDDYEEILDDARKVVDQAIKKGELDRQLKAGDQLDTGLYFRGHNIILEITNRWYPGFGARYSESGIRKRFIGMMKLHHPDLGA